MDMRSSANAERTSITHLQRSERVVFLRWWRCSAGVPAHARGGALRGSTAYGCFCPCFDGLALVTHTQPSSASLAPYILKTSGFVRLHVQKAVTLFDLAYETKTGHRDLLY